MWEDFGDTKWRLSATHGTRNHAPGIQYTQLSTMKANVETHYQLPCIKGSLALIAAKCMNDLPVI